MPCISFLTHAVFIFQNLLMNPQTLYDSVQSIVLDPGDTETCETWTCPLRGLQSAWVNKDLRGREMELVCIPGLKCVQGPTEIWREGFLLVTGRNDSWRKWLSGKALEVFEDGRKKPFKVAEGRCVSNCVREISEGPEAALKGCCGQGLSMLWTELSIWQAWQSISNVKILPWIERWRKLYLLWPLSRSRGNEGRRNSWIHHLESGGASQSFVREWIWLTLGLLFPSCLQLSSVFPCHMLNLSTK